VRRRLPEQPARSGGGRDRTRGGRAKHARARAPAAGRQWAGDPPSTAGRVQALRGQLRSLGEQEAGRVALLPEESTGLRAGMCGKGQQRTLQQPVRGAAAV